MKRCLVTGATGLIGARLVQSLAGSWEVFAAARRTEALPQSIPEDHRVFLDLAADTGVFPERLDAIIHLAQAGNHRDFPESAEMLFRVNTASTVRLLAHGRRAGVKTFVLASTGGVYGSSEQAFAETAPLGVDAPEGTGKDTLGFYLRTRRASESLAFPWSAFFDVIIPRFFFVYGPGQKEAMLIARMIRSVREGVPITLQGKDGLRLNPIHVDDAVRAIVGALGLGRSGIVNIAGPEVLTLRQIAEAIGSAVRKQPTFALDPSATPSHLVADIGRMKQWLGAPSVGFAAGIQTMVES